MQESARALQQPLSQSALNVAKLSRNFLPVRRSGGFCKSSPQVMMMEAGAKLPKRKKET